MKLNQTTCDSLGGTRGALLQIQSKGRPDVPEEYVFINLRALGSRSRSCFFSPGPPGWQVRRGRRFRGFIICGRKYFVRRRKGQERADPGRPARPRGAFVEGAASRGGGGGGTASGGNKDQLISSEMLIFAGCAPLGRNDGFGGLRTRGPGRGRRLRRLGSGG